MSRDERRDNAPRTSTALSSTPYVVQYPPPLPHTQRIDALALNSALKQKCIWCAHLFAKPLMTMKSEKLEKKREQPLIIFYKRDQAVPYRQRGLRRASLWLLR